MGRRRPRLPVFGAAVVVVALWGVATMSPPASSRDAAAATATPAVLDHEVDVAPDGQADAAPGLVGVAHVEVGRYQVELADGTVLHDVTTWDAVARVVVVPGPGRLTDVRFTVDGEPVDSRFTLALRTGR